MSKLCYNQNRGVYEWVHVNETSSVIDVDAVAYQLSNDPIHPDMKVTAEMLTSAQRPCQVNCSGSCPCCIDLGGNGGSGSDGDSSSSVNPNPNSPDVDNDGQLSPEEAADAVEKIVDMSTGELRDSSLFREVWHTL